MPSIFEFDRIPSPIQVGESPFTVTRIPLEPEARVAVVPDYKVTAVDLKEHAPIENPTQYATQVATFITKLHTNIKILLANYQSLGDSATEQEKEELIQRVKKTFERCIKHCSLLYLELLCGNVDKDEFKVAKTAMKVAYNSFADETKKACPHRVFHFIAPTYHLYGSASSIGSYQVSACK